MKKSAKIAGIIFIILAVLDVAFIAAGVNSAHFYIKPLLIPALAAAALLSLLPEHKSRLVCLLAIGMLFHTMGDDFLLFDSKGFIYFALGLASFLIGHIFYLLVLSNGIGKLKGWKELLTLALPLILAPCFAHLFGADKTMTVVLSVYAYALLAIIAVGVLWAIRKRPFACRIILGGIIFIISDSLIGINAFAGLDFPMRGMLIMATYLVAEWLLVSGMTRWLISRQSK